MKFDYCLGNPPYQDSNSNKKLYPNFYIESQTITNISLSLIFPTAWQEPKNLQGLGVMNKKEIKEDKQIVCIKNIHNAFPGVAGVEFTNIILWKKGYDNKLNGKQYIYENNKKEIKELFTEKQKNTKPNELIELEKLVKTNNFLSILDITSGRSTYGIPTNILDYNLPEIHKTKQKLDINRLISKNTISFLDPQYKLPKITSAYSKYKILIPVVWGNFSEQFLGGSYSNIYIVQPRDCCTETFIESGIFETKEQAKNHAKYLMTKFCRALLFVNKHSIALSASVWEAVPLQDYSESWWSEDIDSIDEHLFDKYNVPEDIRQFIRDNIQPRTEKNIINYCEK